jgi:hypothetical protein|tara:strand:- start:305 stop:565 length:261 start_codon:yes stop_codon:yes gene_type:complete
MGDTVNTLLIRYKRLGKQIGTGQTRGDSDIRDEMDEIIIQLEVLGDTSLTDYEAAKKKTKKKDTKFASNNLRSSKDKKFMGHTGVA